MVSFTANKILLDSEAIIEELKAARLRKGLSLEEAGRVLSISAKYLEALEKGDFNQLPAGVYGKNFFKEYAAFLGLDHREIVAVYERETAFKDAKEKDRLFSNQVVRNKMLFTIPRIARNFSILAVIAVCLLYLGYRMERIVSPPVLSLSSPNDNLITDKKNIRVAGATENESEITVNGESVLLDKQGQFLKEINLKNGVNTITVVAKNKYGQVSTISRQILVKEGKDIIF